MKRKSIRRARSGGRFILPVVLVNGEIVGEGNPRLKDVYEEIEKYL